MLLVWQPCVCYVLSVCEFAMEERGVVRRDWTHGIPMLRVPLHCAS